MKYCKNCTNSEIKDNKDYCHIKKYFVSVQADWCKDYELSSELRRLEVAEYLNTLGYDFDLSDQLWMEEFDFQEHKTKDVIDLMLGWSDECLNKDK